MYMRVIAPRRSRRGVTRTLVSLAVMVALETPAIEVIPVVSRNEGWGDG